MRKKNLLFILTSLVMSLAISGCGFFAGLDFDDEPFVPYPSEDESIPEDANYYRAERSKDLYYDLGKQNLYGQFYPNSLGTQKILVIPVNIKGYEKNKTENVRTKIEKAFFGESASGNVFLWKK